MMKGLMDYYMSQAMVVDCIRARVGAEASEVDLEARPGEEFDLTKRLLEEAEEQTEELKKCSRKKRMKSPNPRSCSVKLKRM